MTYIGGQVGRGGTENFVLQLLVRWEAWSRGWGSQVYK